MKNGDHGSIASNKPSFFNGTFLIIIVIANKQISII